MTVLDQIVDRAQGRILVGHHHGIEIVLVAPAVEHDDVRRAVTEQAEILLPELRAQKHDGGGRVARNRLDLGPCRIQIGEVDGDEGGAHAVTARLALDALDHRRVERALIDNLAALPRKHERDGVELRTLLIAHILGGLADDAGGLLAHAALAVERVGNRRRGEPRRTADLSNADLGHEKLLNN